VDVVRVEMRVEPERWLELAQDHLDGRGRMVVAVISGATIIWQVIQMIRERRSPKDPIRAFTTFQSSAASMLAGGQCEFTGAFGRRCRRPGAHADHWIPHTRGGASSDDNLVWACAPHNLRKSARMPSRYATWRVARRRLRYFPPDVSRKPGRRFR